MNGFFLQLVVGSVLQSNGNVEFSQADLTSEEARYESKQVFLYSCISITNEYNTNIHGNLKPKLKNGLLFGRVTKA